MDSHYKGSDRDRHVYLVASRGSLEISGGKVNSGDGVHVKHEAEVRINSMETAEIVLADLPPAT